MPTAIKISDLELSLLRNVCLSLCVCVSDSFLRKTACHMWGLIAGPRTSYVPTHTHTHGCAA
jgi:hypothetical protein